MARVNASHVAEPELAYPRLSRVFLYAWPFWAAIVLISTLSAIGRGYIFNPANLPLDAFLITHAALASVGMYMITLRTVRLPFARQVAITFLVILVMAVPFDAVFQVARTLIGANADELTLSDVFTLKGVVTGGLFWLVPWSLWSAANLAMLHNITSRARERSLAEVERQAHEAQVRALRYQVNPHFLYNTLSSISTLILEGRAAVAERMIMSLSAFFRASLAQDPFLDVRLGDELELQSLYLEIEQMRFADSLKVEYDVPENLKEAYVPSLILQPLVENSIKHGLQEAGNLTTLSISARAVREQLILEVADDGRGPKGEGGTRIGLANVERRLTTRFGSACHFEAGPREGGGFQVRLQLPLQFA